MRNSCRKEALRCLRGDDFIDSEATCSILCEPGFVGSVAGTGTWPIALSHEWRSISAAFVLLFVCPGILFCVLDTTQEFDPLLADT
jgi:hypothetical protein